MGDIFSPVIFVCIESKEHCRKYILYKGKPEYIESIPTHAAFSHICSYINILVENRKVFKVEKVRIGIIGIGNMGSGHAKIIYDNGVDGAVLTAVCDINPKRLDWAKETFGDGVKGFDNGETLVKSGEVDAVIVATPHYDHPEFAIMAMENGLHVLVEKPAGVYTKQVKDMNEAAKKSNKVFGIMFNQRTNPLYRKAKELIERGELGELKRTSWIITDWFRTQSYYNSGGWRATWAGEGGGVLMNQSPHQLDLWQWICGMPKRVRAFCSEGKFHDIEVEDDVTAYVEYENGATGVFITSTGDFPGTNRLEILGDLGKIVIENNKFLYWKNECSVKEYCYTSESGFFGPKTELQELDIEGENLQHLGVLRDWVSAIINDTPLLAPGIEGINGVTLCNAMYLSSWLDNWVDIPFDDDMYYEKLKEKISKSNYKKVVDEKTFNLDGTY